MQCPDEELVLKWKEGDVSAFESLFHRYERRVLSVAVRMVGSIDDAEDLTQETFLRANKCIGGFRGGKFSTWLFKIAANLCLDHAKRRGRKAVSIEAMVEREDWRDLAEPTPGPEDALMREEYCRGVRLALASVPAHYRVLLVLRHVEGMQYEEMAKVIGCSVSALGVRLHRAREVFRERMLPFLKEDGGSIENEMQNSTKKDIAAN